MADKPKPTRQLQLTNDQFEIDDKGQLVIKADEVKKMIETPTVDSGSNEAGAVAVSVTIEVGIGAS